MSFVEQVETLIEKRAEAQARRFLGDAYDSITCQLLKGQDPLVSLNPTREEFIENNVQLIFEQRILAIWREAAERILE